MTLATSCFEEDPQLPPSMSGSASDSGTTTGPSSATDPSTATTTTDPSTSVGPTSGTTTDETDSLDSSTTDDPPPIQCEDGLLGPGELCFGELTALMANEPIRAARIGDVSGSPDADIVYLISDQVVVRVGDGRESFGGEVFSASLTADTFELTDFDGDGELDMAAVGVGEMLRVLLGNGSGSFSVSASTAVGAEGQTLAVGDFEDNGAPDVVVGSGGIGMLYPVLGLGDGELAPLPSLPGFGSIWGVAVADFTGDLEMDVALTIEGGVMDGVAFRMGDGTGGFSDQSTTPGTMSGARALVTGDFDDNGTSDIAYTSVTQNAVGVLLSNGEGGFSAEQIIPVGVGPVALATADFTNDGHDDLVVGHQGENGLRFLLAQPDGMLTEGEPLPLTESIADLATGDVNGDGVPDITAVSDDQPVLLVVLSTP